MKRLTVKTAANLMGIPEQTLRISLQRGLLPFGKAIQAAKGTRYTYWISPVKFEEFTGIKLEEIEHD